MRKLYKSVLKSKSSTTRRTHEDTGGGDDQQDSIEVEVMHQDGNTVISRQLIQITTSDIPFEWDCEDDKHEVHEHGQCKSRMQ